MTIETGEGLSFCGRPLRPDEFKLIQEITLDFRQLALTELSDTVCELLEWRRPNGGLKSRECYLFLQSLQERGSLPWLPPPKPHARRPHAIRVAANSDPQAPCLGSLKLWLPVEVELIHQPADRQLFQQYIHRYHYLGYRVPYGAQLRYFVRSAASGKPVLACLLFTSAAWKMAPRDRYIGWNDAARVSGLPCVINNSRFLILPWVRIAHLASHVLAQAAERIAHLASHVLAQAAERIKRDWPVHYGVEPALLETLVDRSRYAGTCYRAANWTSIGMTQGRGRMDYAHLSQSERKEIFVYPLRRDWRAQLWGPKPPTGATQ